MTTTPTPTPGQRPRAADTSLIPGGMEMVGLTTHVEGRSGWQIFWRGLRRHQLGVGGGGVVRRIPPPAVFRPDFSPHTVHPGDGTPLFAGPGSGPPVRTAHPGQEQTTR